MGRNRPATPLPPYKTLPGLSNVSRGAFQVAEIMNFRPCILPPVPYSLLGSFLGIAIKIVKFLVILKHLACDLVENLLNCFFSGLVECVSCLIRGPALGSRL